MKTIKIIQEEIPVKEKEIKVNDLDFWPENPRVYSALRMDGDETPDQETIFEKMKSLDNVKKLRFQIEKDGGLIEPIYVRNNVVIEGNSRLAAYRLLFKKDVVKWGKIKCYVLPEDLTDELAFALIGTFHISGRAEWSPFEQAGFLYRHLQKSKKPIKALAKDLGLQPKMAQLYADTYETMVMHDDTDQSHWSYYFEMLKNNSIPQMNANHPELNLIDTLCEKIQDGKIEKANKFRDIAKLAASESTEAREAMKAFLNDEESLDMAVAKVSNEDKKKHALKVVNNFREQLTDKEFVAQLMEEDEEFNFIMEKIYTRLQKIMKS